MGEVDEKCVRSRALSAEVTASGATKRPHQMRTAANPSTGGHPDDRPAVDGTLLV